MSDKKLARTTNVGGVTYLAGSTPPADIAEQITNPKCWEDPGDPVGILTGVGPSEVDVERGQGGDADPAPAPAKAGAPAPDSAAGGADVDADELKGAALDQALEDAGLSKTGTVAEKRARLQESQSGS